MVIEFVADVSSEIILSIVLISIVVVVSVLVRHKIALGIFHVARLMATNAHDHADVVDQHTAIIIRIAMVRISISISPCPIKIPHAVIHTPSLPIPQTIAHFF